MRDLLQPATDAAVLGQALVVAVVLSFAWWRARDPDVRRLVLGVAVLTAGLFALRAAH